MGVRTRRRAGLAAAAAAAALALPAVPTAAEQTGRWRPYAAAVPFRWISPQDGALKGHSEDCRLRSCDAADWRRGNLDNSVGLRLGGERDILVAGRLALVGGVEAGLLPTEHNLSQRDFRLAEALLVAGAEADLRLVRLLVRTGLGRAFADDHAHGPATFVEVGVELPLGRATGLRLSSRRGRHAGPATKDVSVAFVGRPDGRPSGSTWHLGWSAGVTAPGVLHGGDLELATSPLVQLSVHRRAGRGRVGLGLGAVAHESRLRSDYGSVTGNQRGKELLELSVLWDHSLGRPAGLPLRWTAAARIASFRDDFPLLRGRGGGAYEAGVAVGAGVGLEAEVARVQGIGLSLAVDHTWWPALGLGELRTRAGLSFPLD